MARDFPIGGRAAALTGRRSECDVLDRLIEAVRRGESAALVVRGEPGVGKTALLEKLGRHRRASADGSHGRRSMSGGKTE